jgi:hypothetical protein
MFRRRLGWEVGAVIGAKLILLTALYFAFFSHPVASPPAAIAAHVMGER